MLDPQGIRSRFPFFKNHPEAVYLDSAASAQKPQPVLDAMQRFYAEDYANVHRGIHDLSQKATQRYEQSRDAVRRFIGASSPEEIIFTKGTTESINLVAECFAARHCTADDTVLLTLLEHHSNIVPWQKLKAKTGTNVAWLDIDATGTVRFDDVSAALKSNKVRMVAITGQSNVLGTRPPLKEIIAASHAAHAVVLVDAAQLVAHHAIDVAELDCDFLAFSGHKLYGPTGIGVLYAKKKLLRDMDPWLGGGGMIKEVTKEGFTPADAPAAFEGGTPPIAQAVGLAAAIEWMGQFPWSEIEEHEGRLLTLAYEELLRIPGVTILPALKKRSESRQARVLGCLSFTVDGIHAHDLGAVLSKHGISMRAGHHCTMPLHQRLGIAASTRLSIGMYTTERDILAVRAAIEEAIRIFRHI